MEPEFFMGDQLRWNWGFENPNKAGALIASLLPVLWIGWALAWRGGNRWGAWVLRVLAGVGLCAGWWALFTTGSRGGVVAALAGCAYAAWRGRRREGTEFCPLNTRKTRKVGGEEAEDREGSDAMRGRGDATLRQRLLSIIHPQSSILASLPGGFRDLAFFACLAGTPSGWARWVGAALLAAVVGALAVATQAADRTFTSITDRSVENRVTLWAGALRMLAENPQGVGRGMSGEAYMQWYQPLEASARYRTLVNSYLTFAVERGLAVAGGVAFAALLVWGMMGRAGGGVTAGLRGALVAFAVAGVFSTTMEEWRLWVVPGLCVAGLAGMAARGWSAIPARRAFFNAAVGTIVLCGVAWGAGAMLAGRAPLKIHIAQMQPPSVVVTPPGAAHEMTVLPDDAVLGRDYGKLLRRLALGTGAKLRVVPSPDAGTWPLMAAGGRVEDVDPAAGRELILLAPAMVTDETRASILSSGPEVLILLPAFDEDGRVDFWNDRAGTGTRAAILSGVGTQVEWAWDEVIEAIRWSDRR